MSSSQGISYVLDPEQSNITSMIQVLSGISQIERFGEPDTFLMEELAKLQDSYVSSLQEMRRTFQFAPWFDLRSDDPARSVLLRQNILHTQTSLDVRDRNELAEINKFIRQRYYLTDTATGLLNVTLICHSDQSHTGQSSVTHPFTPPSLNDIMNRKWHYSNDSERSRRQNYFMEPAKSFRIDQQILSDLWVNQKPISMVQSALILPVVNNIMSYPTATFVESVRNLVTQWYDGQITFPQDVWVSMSQGVESLWTALSDADLFLQKGDYVSIARLMLPPAEEVSDLSIHAQTACFLKARVTESAFLR
ncbi:hypothetical protein TREMEDRAFT_60735 [Tremella mesenterica DSM 1558]|uniref:uncharacterized protein n=1 Tax=Tremella mesenterica (strain ATCC 24925 / CBS 8224 / DSM 1558 / NBRC 9311 / NRRL Y-6157 / RJB 2259-6 / UBC 559-6) TaxID=578456 RepID=UPI0003F49361|nr:uncharacterized protein TREMEDRAFT_60735 [Tremella mesenterica DSM 1558]EIW71818.1 hypothetical protein TREMEDRAFT_60735 [Tremella mesenterica DSM 1558]